AACRLWGLYHARAAIDNLHRRNRLNRTVPVAQEWDPPDQPACARYNETPGYFYENSMIVTAIKSRSY
ncbi:MAG: hypothetical protein WBY75_08000, partial [Terracidiphilus sp.]